MGQAVLPITCDTPPRQADDGDSEPHDERRVDHRNPSGDCATGEAREQAKPGPRNS